MARSNLSSFATAELGRLTGKRYPKLEAAFEALDEAAQQELVRLVHDVTFAVRQAAQKAAREPWRHGR